MTLKTGVKAAENSALILLFLLILIKIALARRDF